MNQQGSTPQADFALRRAALGVCSILILLAGGAVFLFGSGDAKQTVAPVFLRMAMVMGAIWLALPELQGLSRSISGKGTALIAIGLVLASISKVSVLPLTILGGVALAVYGIKCGWRWLLEPVPKVKRKVDNQSRSTAPTRSPPGPGRDSESS
ncbi:MAG: hypothetical protein VB877_00025 [Pirellulaceae bacterium]